MKKKFCFCALLSVFALSLQASLPAAKVFTTDEEINLDGKLTEESWKKAPVYSKMSILKNASVSGDVSHDMKFRILQGKRGLYCGVEVKDSTIKSAKYFRNGPVWHDDSVEIFLAPVKEFSFDKNVREVYQFLTNADGSRYSLKYVGGVSSIWECAWRAASSRTKEGWNLEIYIPFYPFADSTSNVWRLNLIRNDHPSPTPYHVWSPAVRFSDPDSMGYLEGISFDREFYKPSIDKFRMENGILSGTVKNAGKRNLAVKAMFRKNDKFAAFGSAEINRKGEFSMKIAPGEGTFDGELYLTNGNYTVSSLTRKILCTKAPAAVRMTRPNFRNTLFPDEPREFTADVRFFGSNQELTFTLTDEKGTKLAEQVVKKGGKLRFSAEKLAPGKYTIRSQQITIPVRIFGKGNYVRIDSEGRCLVNGKFFYPRAFEGCGQKSLPILASHGYNLAHSYVLHYEGIDKILARLDNAHKQGLMVFFVPFHKTRAHFFGFNNEKGMMERMEKLVLAVKEHPAFFGWYLYDEPRGAEYTAKLKDLYHKLRELDPGHPVIGCDNSADGCISKAGMCDIHQLDLYPSPDLKGKMFHSISSIVKATQTTAAGVAPDFLWYVPQGFDRCSFSKLEKPNARGLTIQEIRISVYGSIAAGACGISVYKIGDPGVSPRHGNSGIFATEEMRKGYLEVLGPELKSLEKVLLSPSFYPEGKGIMRGWHTPDGDWILVTNPETEKAEAVLKYDAPLKEWKGNRTFPKGEKRIKLEPYEVLFLKQ